MLLKLLLTLLSGMAMYAYSQTKIPKLVVNMGHTAPIESIRLTEDQKYIISCAKKETKLWDFKTGRLIRNLKRTGKH